MTSAHMDEFYWFQLCVYMKSSKFFFRLKLKARFYIYTYSSSTYKMCEIKYMKAKKVHKNKMIFDALRSYIHLWIYFIYNFCLYRITYISITSPIITVFIYSNIHFFLPFEFEIFLEERSYSPLVTFFACPSIDRLREHGCS